MCSIGSPVIVPYDGKSRIRISTKPFINDFLPWFVTVKMVGMECAAHDIILQTVPFDCAVQILLHSIYIACAS